MFTLNNKRIQSSKATMRWGQLVSKALKEWNAEVLDLPDRARPVRCDVAWAEQRFGATRLGGAWRCNGGQSCTRARCWTRRCGN